MDLRLEQLRKRFGNRWAVDIPALTIREGEFFTFVGPSGCGKSTTLNLIAGLEEPTDGSLWLGERRLNDFPPHKRNVAFVFQTYALYPHRTVFENLSFPLELAGVARPQIRERVEEVAGLLGLTPLLAKHPAQLSGGERQRVAVGRAIVRQPQLFLFDEPLSNLDAPLRAQMRKELKRLHQKLGTTFIYVTHDQEEALSLSDRVAVMQAGQIEQCGSPREVYEQPANTFVASFFGSPPINLLSGEWREEGNQARVRLARSFELRLPVASGGARPSSKKVVVGIRPEQVEVHRPSGRADWTMEVILVEPHGGQTHLELEAEGLRLMAVARAEADLKPGEQVRVEMPPEGLHWFDADSGDRLGFRAKSRQP
jgi:multiple sugar transport system ATP-binding protein